MLLFEGLFLLSLSGLLFKNWRHALAQQLKIEQEGYHTRAVVREYRKEYVRVAGSWDWLWYPYVEYVTLEGQVKIDRLKYAQSPGRAFEVGEQIEVIRFADVLYHPRALYGGSYLMLALALGSLLGSLFLIIKAIAK